MLELRSRGREIVKCLEHGERLELTYRGKKVGIIEPALSEGDKRIPIDDPIRTFHGYAQPLGSMTNQEIDRLLYGEEGCVS